MEEKAMSKNMKLLLLVINCLMLGIGNCIAPIMNRLYSVKGGKRIWLMCALETAGCPFLLIPYLIYYFYRRRKHGPETKLMTMSSWRLALYCVVIGILTGLDDLMDAAGVSKLPVSTYSLVLASQLGFTALFARILVKQKFTFLHINAIVLLTAGAAVLAFNSGSDVPTNESKGTYVIGFLMTLGVAVLYGLVLPSVELMYKKAKQTMTYSLVIEMQIIISLSATILCVVGMVINNDFPAIPREAASFELGKTMYYLVLVADAFLWQLFFLGAIGVIFCNNSLLSGILISALLPVSEVLAVFMFGEKFTPEKGISLFLALWGSVSYFYQEAKQDKENKRIAEHEQKELERIAAQDEDQFTDITQIVLQK